MTNMGENGIRLSGGQKQRIALARVMLRNPNVIILDESTSALEYNSEQNINEIINSLYKDKTVIIIAHRLSEILECDKVVVVDDGEIVGQGTHKQLLENNAIYSTLFKDQFEAI